ncbi:MAG: hemolysin family protein [Acidobacteria bacterium]|nr:hemolysin family protein [Acidobacteriota bacterium]
MSLAFFVTLALLAGLVVLSSFVQLLYLESLRLRSRESASLNHFKEEYEDRLGLKLETGALTFSLIKHSLIALLGVFAMAFMGMGHEEFWNGLAEAGIAACAAVLLCSQIIPQLLYRKTAGFWLIAFFPLVKVLIWIAAPIIAILRFLQALTELGATAEQPDEQEEQIEALINAGKEEGLIEEEDRKLIQSVVEFGDKTVKEVMTPRPRMVGIEKGATANELRQLVINEQYSRIPVFDGTIDDVVGFIHVRDMFMQDEKHQSAHVWELMRPIRKVPESKKVTDLLREMQHDGAHIAVVIDEYGNTAGLSTMEDLVEEIFGEIRDEHEPTQDLAPDGEGAWIVSGSFDVDHLNGLLEYRPDEEFESTTVGGLVAEWLGRVPRVGEGAERDGIRLEVLAANDRRVDRVRVSRMKEEFEEELNA